MRFDVNQFRSKKYMKQQVSIKVSGWQSFVTYKLVALICMLCLVIQGCVTVEEGGNTKNPEKAAEAYTALAAQYIRQNNLGAAKRNAEKALEIKSRYAPALNMMGVILQRDGSPSNLEKAESYFRRAIRSDEDYIQARNNFGVYLSEMKRYPEAIKQFRIAGSSLGYEGRVAALENLGRTALLLRDYKMAEQAFRQALSINSYSLVSRVELVDILIKKNNFEKAHPIYQDYINILGDRSQGARSLLQGIIIANALNDSLEFRRLYSNLKEDYPNSKEMQQFHKLFSTE